MAFTSQIEAADKASAPGKLIDADVHRKAEHILAMPAGRRDAATEERRLAAACIRRMAGDGADDILEALGLATPQAPPPPAPKPKPAKATKRCSRCKKTKHVEEFDRNRSNCDGRSYECKACRTCVHEQRKNRIRVTPDAKRCVKCQLTKPASEFSRDKSNVTNLTARCKACRNTAKRGYRAAARKKETVS
jgi:hypothetical protein